MNLLFFLRITVSLPFRGFPPGPNSTFVTFTGLTNWSWLYSVSGTTVTCRHAHCSTACWKCLLWSYTLLLFHLVTLWSSVNCFLIPNITSVPGPFCNWSAKNLYLSKTIMLSLWWHSFLPWSEHHAFLSQCCTHMLWVQVEGEQYIHAYQHAHLVFICLGFSYRWIFQSFVHFGQTSSLNMNFTGG